DVCAAGIEPCVQFDATAMRFIDPCRQRIPGRIGCLALGTGEIEAPWFERGVIDSIGGGAHLKNDGVELEFDGEIKVLADFRELFFR
ncbi:MAG: hypothetical protein RL215_1606, partial [Planctomycetota bacterium]